MKKMAVLFALFCVVGFVNAQPSETTAAQSLQTRKAVENFLDQLGKKDADKMALCFSEKVDWYIFESPKFPWTGRRTQRSEIAAVFKTLFSYFVDGKEKFRMDSFMVDGNDAAIFAELGRQFKKSGKDFSMYIAIHFKVENGLITKFYLYEQTPILEKAYE